MSVKFYQASHITIDNSDCRNMADLADETVQCVVTSPPYFGLRKYAGLPDLVWGGDKNCKHEWITEQLEAEIRTGKGLAEWSAIHARGGGHKAGAVDKIVATRGFCSLCSAWKGQLGLEPSPELYIQHTIEILREIRRVLRKDGVVFWNCGDSYWGGKGQSGQPMSATTQQARHERGESINQSQYQMEMATRPQDGRHNILKPKSLCLIPFRVAIAAQEDGWWVRSVIIWSKPNPMPESVTDRPTNSHEYVLMLTRSGTTQYWTHRDSGGARTRPKPDYRWIHQLTQKEVVIEPKDWKEKITCPECEGKGEVEVYLGLDVWQTTKCPTCNGKKKIQLWRRRNLWKGHDYYWDADAVREAYSETVRWGGDKYKGAIKKGEHGEDAGLDRERSCFPNTGRNLRNVWSFPTKPYPEAHFAVFPEKLPEICIKAATPEAGCCSKCGAPWVRITEKSGLATRPDKTSKYGNPEEDIRGRSETLRKRIINEIKTLGWRPTCSCNADKVPSIVLDPFAGSGTTLAVAKRLGRHVIGYELSVEYCKLAQKRIGSVTAPLPG